MRKILEYLRLILFMGGVLVGIQMPGFVDQYGKSLESHFRESVTSLEGFQDDANKYFSGDLDKLIEHYQSDHDPVFKDGGNSINDIYNRNILLGKAIEEFNENACSSYLHVILNPIPEIKNEVWESYTYNIMLDMPAIIWGLIAGFMLTAITEFTIFLLISLGRFLKNQLRSTQKARG
jgi:hypothetical protein